MQNENNNVPKDVVDEFTNALNDHEKELRTQMTHHLDGLEGKDKPEPEQKIHHIDVSDSGMENSQK
jgi:TRAP-type uncharacterized transport system substrate-binding protein